MGSLLSKTKASAKVVPADPRVSSSAPAKLENLEGTSPSPASSLRPRAITPPESSFTPAKPLSPKERRNSLPADMKAPDIERKPLPLSVLVEGGTPAPSALPTPTGVAPVTPSGGPAGAAAKRGPKKIDVIGDQSDGQKLAADLPAATAIPDDSQAWAKVYGEAVIRNFLSPDWKEREHSLSSILRCLSNAKFLAGKEPASVYAVTAEMLTRTLKDKVAPIFHASLELVSTLLASFCNCLPKHVLNASMDPIMPIIVHRCGNLNTRIHESSLQALVSVANFANFGCSYVGPFALAEPPKRNRDASQAAQLYGRLDLVGSLLATYKSTDGLPLPEVLKFAKQGLENADDKVRQAAIKVIVEMYKVQKGQGKELQVEKHMGLLKPALMQVLQKRFMEADNELACPQSGAADRNNTPASSTGIKVFGGKSLPPLKQSASMNLMAQGVALKPGTPEGAVTSRTASPASPGMRSRQPLPGTGSQAKRERARMAGAPPSPPVSSRPRTPLGSLPELEVSAPNGSGKLTGSGRLAPPRSPAPRSPAPQTPRSPGALDDAEEQLIQYIMGDNKMMT